MARGQSQAADSQLGKTNAIGADEQKKSNALESSLIPGYTSLMDTGYLSPTEEHSAVASEMGAATEPFHSAEFEAKNRAAATRNPADVTAQQDQLALEEGRTAGGAAEKLQEEKMQNQEAGMYGLSNLKSEDQRAMEAMYGLGPSTLNARAAGASGDQLGMGWASTFLNPASSAYQGRNG